MPNSALTAKQKHQLEQKESAAALELLNEIEKQKQQQRLEELKRNKHKLLQLLKEKETESAQLAKLYSSYTDNKPGLLKELVEEPEDNVENVECDSEDQLDSCEQHTSPSDMLWNQMKKQLNMRENLRSKKKELEDLIRDENARAVSSPDTSINEEGEEEQAQPDEENNENNKIVNCYREFLLKNKLSFSQGQSKNEYEYLFEDKKPEATSPVSSDQDSDNEGANQEEEDEDEEEIIMKRYVPHANPKQHADVAEQTKQNSSVKKVYQQHNICSTDELIKEPAATEPPQQAEMNILSNLSSQFTQLVQNQQKLNESMQKNFEDLLKTSATKQQSDQSAQTSSQPTNDSNSLGFMITSQFQFQMQMQMQQMMFNMNSMQQEMASQRVAISQCNEQLKQANSKWNESLPLKHSVNKRQLSKFTNTASIVPEKQTTTIGTNTFACIQTSEASKPIATNALPSYFYTRRQQQRDKNNEETLTQADLDKYAQNFYETAKNATYEKYLAKYEAPHYTDDFDEDDEDDKNVKPVHKKHTERTCSSSSSSASITTATSSSRSGASKSTRSNGELLDFEHMREKIYSEVANLISQNETRPFYLINLFKELQYLKDKNARDQVLKNIFNIANRQQSMVSEKSSTETLPQMQSASSTCEPIAANKALVRPVENDHHEYMYRMNKLNSLNKPLNGKQRRVADSHLDNEELTNYSSQSQSPFESDSLSNTVIFVKKSPQTEHQKASNQLISKRDDTKFSRSSSSSMIFIFILLKHFVYTILSQWV